MVNKIAHWTGKSSHKYSINIKIFLRLSGHITCITNNQSINQSINQSHDKVPHIIKHQTYQVLKYQQ
jgi:hypothetical protein